MIRVVHLRPVFALVLMVLAAGCGGANEPAPVDRAELTAAFAGIDEPLTLRLDMRLADPGSVVDAIFVPASADVPDPPFEVDLFDNEDAARENSQSAERVVASEKAEIVLHKNVAMLLARSVAREQRNRLVAALTSL
jgi:hypothetical protein